MFIIISFSFFWLVLLTPLDALKHSVVVEVDEAFRKIPTHAESDDVENGQRCHRVQENFGPLQNIQSAEVFYRKMKNTDLWYSHSHLFDIDQIMVIDLRKQFYRYLKNATTFWI